MDLVKQIKYANEEYLRQIAPYQKQLFQIEMRKFYSYRFNTTTKELTRIEQPLTMYEVYLHDNIEEIKVSVFHRFNIINRFENEIFL